MSQSTIALTLGKITVRQHNGLFSLNDLHKASGGEENFKPAFCLLNDQAKALIAEIAKGADLHLFLNTTKGRNGSTYACRELVIAYAAWISAAFHLKVIRVFLAVAAPQPEPIQTALDYDRISPAQAVFTDATPNSSPLPVCCSRYVFRTCSASVFSGTCLAFPDFA